ncbi:MAG TPA: glycine zipper domain-containing protein [Rhizomicrobium sp.]|nr:glycine zipper domain-containing protein [Rhizomicrobium sp.]
MSIKKALLAACAAATLVSGAAVAQPGWVPPGNDPNGYYSDADHDGYYDRDGHYHRIRFRDRGRYDRDYGPPPPAPAYGPPPAPAAYYEPGRYEESCHRGSAVNGTIFGALAGGLIGGLASHGNAGATVGGVVVGGVLGNVIGRDIDCEDQPRAYRVYADSLNGDIGRPYEWHSDRGNRGTFTSTREFRRGGQMCREFTETSWRGGQNFTRSGIACRDTGNGHWRFD